MLYCATNKIEVAVVVVVNKESRLTLNTSDFSLSARPAVSVTSLKVPFFWLCRRRTRALKAHRHVRPPSLS